MLNRGLLQSTMVSALTLIMLGGLSGRAFAADTAAQLAGIWAIQGIEGEKAQTCARETTAPQSCQEVGEPLPPMIRLQ